MNSKEKALEYLDKRKDNYSDCENQYYLGDIERALDIAITSEQEKAKKEKKEIFKYFVDIINKTENN